MRLKKIFLKCFLLFFLPFTISSYLFALNVGDKASHVILKNQTGTVFNLNDNKNKFWTVLYFYPKADTPGCTKQACAFRDAIKVIEKQNAKIYGVSTDSQKDLLAFKEKHKLNFDLLSDEDGKVCESFETKAPLLNISKRHTFIIDPQLIIRYIDRDVDPAKDAQTIADKLKELQKTSD